jgi:hypothetical protein
MQADRAGYTKGKGTVFEGTTQRLTAPKQRGWLPKHPEANGAPHRMDGLN